MSDSDTLREALSSPQAVQVHDIDDTIARDYHRIFHYRPAGQLSHDSLIRKSIMGNVNMLETKQLKSLACRVRPPKQFQLNHANLDCAQLEDRP